MQVYSTTALESHFFEQIVQQQLNTILWPVLFWVLVFI